MAKLKHERICIVCGKHYSYCSRCKEYNQNEQWRYIYCDQDCKEMYYAYGAFQANMITKDEALETLSKKTLAKDAPMYDEIEELKPVVKSTKASKKEATNPFECLFDE